MYIDTETLAYPVTEQDIRALHPNTSFASPFVAPEPYVVVFPAPQPAYNAITQTVREIAPELTEKGHWEQQWDVVDLFDTPEEEAGAIAAYVNTLRVAKNVEINSARLQANFGSFAYSGKTFATDQLSRSDIDGINGYVALYGSLPAGWPGAWKAVDNSYLAIPDVAAWKSFYAAMVSAGNANFAKAQALKAALQAATTPEAVAAVVW